MSDEVLPHIRDEHDRPLNESAIHAAQQVRTIFSVDPRRSPADTVNDLLDRTKYDSWLKVRYEEKGEYEARSRNVNELANSIANFAKENPRADLAKYLQSISLYTDGDDSKDNNAVRLMSLHASKGLEFDAVYMIGCEQGILPHEKAVKDRGDRGLEEERRLCYVGFTRAKKLLRVAWCQTRQDVFARTRKAIYLPTLPSQFLAEAGLISAADFTKAQEHHAESKRPLGKPAKKKPPRLTNTFRFPPPLAGEGLGEG